MEMYFRAWKMYRLLARLYRNMSFRPLSGLKALGKNDVLNSTDLLLNSL
ncbi:Unknown protein sequence [Pseudomonas syringae pv. maculicola]|nr:Unknown protein sequence [Pseudomonas syringae pv. maculicola str. M6]KPC00586.1 Unknown protein sequence [Pseudomonas syringae pv. maculicola]